MSEYNICYSLDSKYAEQLAVSITSIIKNADVNDIVNFYILDGGLTKTDKSDIELLKNIKNFNIEYISINPEDFNNCPLLKDKDIKYSDYHVTLPTYFRFKSASIFKKLNKILYLDCDVIVRKSLKELFETDIEKSAVSMVLDVESKKEAVRLNLKKYYNAGVMLINLDYWRKNDVENRLFNYAFNNKDNILWQDQDILNCVLADEIKKLGEKWNYQYFLYENIDIKKLADCVILHLSGRFKPWLIHFEHPVYDEYYYYLSFTPWRNKILEYKQLCNGKFLKDNIGGHETNIIPNATKADLYSEVEKSYKYSNKLLNDLKENLKIDTDKKIQSVYEEVSKNYEYIDKNILETKEIIKIDTDKKIQSVYDEVSKNYEYIDKNILEAKEIIKIDTDKKIQSVYDEVSKNYEYIDKNILEAKEIIKIDTDKKIQSVYDEISKNYEYADKTAEKLEYEIGQDINNKLNLIYEDLSKNYKYTDKAIFDASIHERNKRDEKVNACFDEITRNYKYTEKLIEDAKNFFEQKIMDKSNEIYKYINVIDEELKIKYEIADNDNKDSIKKDYNNLITNEVSGLNYRIVNIENQSEEFKNEILNKNRNQIKELYTYINEQSIKIINEMIGNNKINEEQVNNKITSVNNYINYVENNLKSLEQNIYNKARNNEIDNFGNEFNKKLDSMETYYQNKINELESLFADKLNKQRIHYEEKLLELERRLEKFDKIYESKSKGKIFQLKTKSPGKEVTE